MGISNLMFDLPHKRFNSPFSPPLFAQMKESTWIPLLVFQLGPKATSVRSVSKVYSESDDVSPLLLLPPQPNCSPELFQKPREWAPLLSCSLFS